ncbi:hypothetical protein V6N11_053235 [Hibiscus sabdariffa]|uniref:Uncharacterized protein n=1 Tax=Hibiscus sabdariffa TaxID=183260 RepID=A0ABR2UD88_9ROSI
MLGSFREMSFSKENVVLLKKDLEKHYKAMIKLFYALGADQSLKQVILSSIPELLQNAVDRNLQRSRKHILQLTIGEIQQETFIALEELCDRKKTIKEYLTGTKELDKACKTPWLTIKYELSDQSLFAIQVLDEEPEDVEMDWSSDTIYML